MSENHPINRQTHLFNPICREIQFFHYESEIFERMLKNFFFQIWRFLLTWFLVSSRIAAVFYGFIFRDIEFKNLFELFIIYSYKRLALRWIFLFYLFSITKMGSKAFDETDKYFQSSSISFHWEKRSDFFTSFGTLWDFLK